MLGLIRSIWDLIPPKLQFACLGLGGATVGLAAYVALISNAASYMSDDPRACINCHIMNPEYATWERSSHARVTNCNDCHVPHDSVFRKYFFKAKDGSRHSLLFTLGKERQVIQAIPESKEVIQENCIRCHGQAIAEVKLAAHDTERPCIDCHREVPHGG